MFPLAQIDLTTLPENAPIWLIILFMGIQIANLLWPKLFPPIPVVNPPPTTPTDPPVIVTPPVVVDPVKRPLLDAIVKLLTVAPTYLPLLPVLLTSDVETVDRMRAEAEAKKS